ncbi:LysR substrate-binding domain-containing protein [Kocuria sp. TGY1127_2]|uniref:LysR family transcriptional regulator n=1 Tax=Kocuria sp. TGY1127_2 TaxID=2711328 RepID=UPI0015BD5BA0|nr:LysR substrate-binding domain-containing protein [Kocuria sp. TGY1127_2]
MMELRWLEAFVAVAEELHFGRAAERLHMAQSPLSQVIRKLEKNVGSPLFKRSTRTVELTAPGQALLPYAYRILRSLNNAMDAARSAEGVPTGRFTLGFSGMHNHDTLPRITRALRENFPGVDLNLVGGIRTFDGMRQVRNEDLDASFLGIIGDVGTPLRAREISRHHLGVVVPTDHPLAHRDAIPIHQLRGESFVMGPVDGNSSMTVAALQICHAAGFQPEIAQAVSDPFLIVSMVAAGVGITILPSEVLPILPEAATWIELEGDPVPFSHGVVWSDDNESEPLQAFLTILDSIFPEPTLQ